MLLFKEGRGHKNISSEKKVLFLQLIYSILLGVARLYRYRIGPGYIYLFCGNARDTFQLEKIEPNVKIEQEEKTQIQNELNLMQHSDGIKYILV